jgi:hypothetical protein
LKKKEGPVKLHQLLEPRDIWLRKDSIKLLNLNQAWIGVGSHNFIVYSQLVSGEASSRDPWSGSYEWYTANTTK